MFWKRNMVGLSQPARLFVKNPIETRICPLTETLNGNVYYLARDNGVLVAQEIVQKVIDGFVFTQLKFSFQVGTKSLDRGFSFAWSESKHTYDNLNWITDDLAIDQYTGQYYQGIYKSR